MEFDSKSTYRADFFLILRGLLVWTIVFHHWGYPRTWYSGTNWEVFHGWMYFGLYSVNVFYAISGYLIGKVLNTKYEYEGGKLHYLINRMIRIIPIYLVILAISMAITITARPDNQFGGQIADYGLSTLFMIFYANYQGTFNFLNPPIWALAIEFQFYLIAPLLALLFNKRKINTFKKVLWGFAAVLIVSLLIRAVFFNGFLPYGRSLNSPVYVMGIETNLIYFLAGWLSWLGRDQLKKIKGYWASIGLLGVVVVCWYITGKGNLVETYGANGSPVFYFVFPVLIAITCFLLLPSLDQPFPKPNYYWKPFGDLLIISGLSSYVSFLLHVPFRNLHSFPAVASWWGKPSLLGLLLVSFLLYYFIEKPFDKFKKIKS